MSMLRVAWVIITCLFSMVATWCPNSNPCCMGTNPASWDAWSYWSDCYPDCGYGTRERSRYCLPASECPDCTAYYDCYCDGQDHQTESCYTPKNPPSWSYWGAWGDCYPECGYGTKYRYRDCEPDYYCPDCNYYDCECPGSDTDEMECYTPENLPEWGEWFPWGECSESCDRGVKSRYRECLPPYVCPDDCYYYGSCYCYGDDYETMECKLVCTSIFLNEELSELTVTASDNAKSALDAFRSSGSYWTPGVNNVAYWRAYLPKDSCCRIVYIWFEYRYSAGILVSEMLHGANEFTPVQNIPSPPNEDDRDWKFYGTVFLSDVTRKIELEVSPSSLTGPKAGIRNVELAMCCG